MLRSQLKEAVWRHLHVLRARSIGHARTARAVLADAAHLDAAVDLHARPLLPAVAGVTLPRAVVRAAALPRAREAPVRREGAGPARLPAGVAAGRRGARAIESDGACPPEPPA